LVLALNLLLRPSQQYSAQPAVSHALNISTSRLQSLAKRWPNLREFPIGLIDLGSTSGSAAVDALPAEARQVNYSFYRTEQSSAKEKVDQMDTDVFESAEGSCSKKPTSASFGPTTIHIDERALASKVPMEVLADIIQSYSLPSSEKFEVLCRIRAASSLIPGEDAQVLREKLVVVRLLAIAIFGHTHNESTAISSLFLYEPDLIIHIAELLQLDRGVSIAVQTAAIAALDALARYRGKIQEVLSAINAGVNHGILMALVRKTVSDVSNSESTLPHSFAEALLSFVTFIASHAAGGNMVVGAGLVPLLIQLIENKLPGRLGVVSKTMQLVDNVLYSFTNAFQLFCSARGVEVLVDRIEVGVRYQLRKYDTEGTFPSMKLTWILSSMAMSRSRVKSSGHMVRPRHFK
jgi:E3 ubiquitin-protein ligase HUWE1